jgi:hypothetical protein
MIGGVDVQGIYPATAAVFVVHGVVLRLLVEAWLIDGKDHGTLEHLSA